MKEQTEPGSPSTPESPGRRPSPSAPESDMRDGRRVCCSG